MSQQLRLTERTLDEAIAEAHQIVQDALEQYQPAKTFALFSGGNDSLVLLDTMAEYADAVVHVNTGIGIPETNVFARKVGSSYGKPFIELHPPVPYEKLVLELPVLNGMPGPGVHHIIYQRLKERCIRALIRDHRTKRGQQFLLLTGVRKAESKRRMGYRHPVDVVDGSQVWANPLLWWTNDEMKEYRTSRNLPVNEVSANLHMSGECLCGAMADQDASRSERAAIAFFYPEFHERLLALEEECRRRNLRYCEWGVKRPNTSDGPAGHMCQSCAYRQEALAL